MAVIPKKPYTVNAIFCAAKSLHFDHILILFFIRNPMWWFIETKLKN